MPHLQTRKRRRQNEIIHMSVLQLVSSWRFIKLEPIIYGICIGCGSALSDYITSNLERYALKRNKSTKPAASKAFWSISNIKVANTVPPNIISFFLMQRSQKQTNKQTKNNNKNQIVRSKIYAIIFTARKKRKELDFISISTKCSIQNLVVWTHLQKVR